MTKTRFLTSDDVADLATPDEYVDAVRAAYRQRGDGAPAEPRTKLLNDDPPGFLTTYAAVLPETGAMGGYMYSAGFADTDAWFFTPLFDAETGAPLALLDGASMNPYKTGATGAVGVDALAREDAKTVAVIGSGAQARGQLICTNEVRAIDTVSVFSPTDESRKAFADEMNNRLDASVTAVASSTAAIDGADIIITATTASEPVFDGANLEPGTHVTAMGQYTPGKRELDTTTVANATYVPDLRDRVFQDAGSFLQALDDGAITEDHVHAELGEIIAGHAPGRQSADEFTLFDSGGTGIETTAAAYLLYQKAVEHDSGQTIELAPASEALTGQ